MCIPSLFHGIPSILSSRLIEEYTCVLADTLILVYVTNQGYRRPHDQPHAYAGILGARVCVCGCQLVS